MDLELMFQNYEAKLIGLKREYTVAILLTEIDGEDHIIFEKRGKNISQPGEVSLPGGRVDNGEKPIEAIKREVLEEIKIEKSNINIIGEMDYLCNFHSETIRVFLGKVVNFKIEEFVENDEVEKVFTYPIRYFIENKPTIYNYYLSNKFDENFPFHLIQNGDFYKTREISQDLYIYKNTRPVIWGFTAKIISKFIDIYEGELNG